MNAAQRKTHRAAWLLLTPLLLALLLFAARPGNPPYPANAEGFPAAAESSAAPSSTAESPPQPTSPPLGLLP
ncbi:MAG: hypothetical protein OXU71_11935 [Gammaproteobacteria bacterium]|nr:hypothetical protein [Gammaproteobacteria bacterium]